MMPREELTLILRDRQRVINSPEAHAMRGGLSDSHIVELLDKWRAIVAAESLHNPLTGDTV